MYLRTDRRELCDDFAESTAHTDTKSSSQAPWFTGNLDTAQPRFVSSYAQRFCVLDIAPVRNIAPLPDGRSLFILQIYVHQTEHVIDKLETLAKHGHIEYVPYVGHLQRLANSHDAGLPLHTWLFADKQPAITLATGMPALDICRPLTQFKISHTSTDIFEFAAVDPFADFIDLVGDEAARRAQWKIIADAKYPTRHFPTAWERIEHRRSPAAGLVKHARKLKIK